MQTLSLKLCAAALSLALVGTTGSALAEQPTTMGHQFSTNGNYVGHGSSFWRHGGRHHYGHRHYRHYRHRHHRHHRHGGSIVGPAAGFVAGAIVGSAIANGGRHYSGGSDHVRWCYDHYRSYRASDDTYQPYHGPRRVCRGSY